MSTLGNVRVGKKAPDFRCEAVYKGIIEEVNLSTYINENKKSWLVLLFIPAAFSFVCPTEVLAFQNCLDEFKDRNCEVIFISVDTKHSLWHWQNVPRQYGGLGQIDIALLSDANHKMSRDYGVLIEEEGVCLRGMFVLDDEAVVQQITLNNLTVGRSVLEALRLLEAFQAVAKHGVLCPIDWRPSNDTTDIAATISSTLTESYEVRLANLQKEFGDTVVTDLDAKHKRDSKASAASNEHMKRSRQNSNITMSSHRRSLSTPSTRKTSVDAHSRKDSDGSKATATSKDTTKSNTGEEDSLRNSSNDCLPHAKANGRSTRSRWSFKSDTSTKSPTAPQSAGNTPMPGLSRRESLNSVKQHSQNNTARHARGHCSGPAPPKLTKQVSQPNGFVTDGMPPTPSHLLGLSPRLTYESRSGSQVILEFADPTGSPQASPHPTPGQILPGYPQYLAAPLQSPSLASTPRPSGVNGLTPETPGAGGQTRLQATFEAIKKMSAGLTSPSPKRFANVGKGERKEEVQTPGYFDVIVDAVDY